MLRDFLAFQRAKELHQHCKRMKLPVYVLDQLLRATLSIALNLAEGSGKTTEKDQKRYYAIALGSIRECEALFQLEEVSDARAGRLLNEVAGLTVRLMGFRKLSRSNANPNANANATANPNANANTDSDADAERGR